jgi:hypothetical protein
MSDNIGYTPGSGATIAADNVGGALHQRVKMVIGADGVNDGDVSSANPLPVSGPLTDTQLRADALSTVDVVVTLTGAAAQTATVNNILESVAGAAGTAVDNIRSGSVQVISTGTAGTFIFEQSNDGTNWVTLPVWTAALASGGPTAGAITASASAGVYTFPVRSQFIRLRIATTITGGSIQAISRLSTEAYAPTALTAFLGASAARVGYVASAGIWYDDTSTALAANATFTGTSRDATVTATATAFASASAYPHEIRACAESDVTGTLWLEVSRDNTNWRRIRSVATTAITGGGFAAELLYRPAWRYWRIGYTNGATIQVRFTLGTIAAAV